MEAPEVKGITGVIDTTGLEVVRPQAASWRRIGGNTAIFISRAPTTESSDPHKS
jgi:hypothetical protein